MTIIITFLKLTEQHWRSLTIFLLTVITILSLRPLEELPPFPGGDKVHHLIAYTALMFPTAVKKPVNWWAIALLFIVWSGAIELLQPYVNRYGELQDLAANITGLIFGWLIAFLLQNFLARY